MTKRERLIRDGLNKWNKCRLRGILKYATGVGKTFAAMLACKYFIGKYNKRVLVVCKTYLQIENMKKEFKAKKFSKFGFSKLLKNIDFICYASLMKSRDDVEYCLVILDEVHNVVSDKRIEYFKNPDCLRILGLTASLSEYEEGRLKNKLPVVDELSLKDVADEDFISEFTIFNLGVKLTKEEQEEYDKTSASIKYAWEVYERQAWKKINKRTRILHSAENKMKLVPKLVELFPDEYGAIFTLTKESADRIAKDIGETCISVHSGYTKKQIKENLDRFSDGRTNTKTVVSAKILDEGVTLPRLSYGILVARNGKVRQFIQTIGRILRNEDGKHAFAVRLFCEGTVEENWLESSQEDFNIKHVSTYEELRSEIQKIRKKSE